MANSTRSTLSTHPSVLILVGALALTACNKKASFTSLGTNAGNPGGTTAPLPPGGGGGPGPSCGPKLTDRFNQPSAPPLTKIDLLYVTDTSGSLDDERTKIADGISAVRGALSTNTDMRAAVVLAHGPQNALAPAASPWFGALYTSSSGEAPVLDSQQLNETQFRTQLRQKLVASPTHNPTDGGEAGIASYLAAIQGARLSAARAQGFFRADAALAVLFVSDENDLCGPGNDAGDYEGFGSATAAQQYFASFCPANPSEEVLAATRALQAGSGGERPFIVGGIVYNDSASVPAGGENSLGLGYLEAIARAGQYSPSSALTINLALTNYNPGLSELGRLIQNRLDLRDRFTLAGVPAAGSIEVRVDGAPSTFTFDATTNSVSPSNLGGASSLIEVSYCPTGR